MEGCLSDCSSILDIPAMLGESGMMMMMVIMMMVMRMVLMVMRMVLMVMRMVLMVMVIYNKADGNIMG